MKIQYVFFLLFFCSCSTKTATKEPPQELPVISITVASNLQRRRAGHPLVQSALEAASLRIRPIIMTSFAFVAGMIPVMGATGPSANGNHSISIAAAGGMMFGVILGLSFIPVLFVVFQFLQEKGN